MIATQPKAQEEYEQAKAVSDELLEQIQANDAMGIKSSQELRSQFSKAYKKTRFWKRRLDELKA